MTDLNHVTLIGRLTRDAELKYTPNGFAISNFSIAVNRRRKNGEQWVEEANFFDITLYGKSAESLKQYLIKGKQIAVDGELRQDRWEQDGQQRSKVVIAANNVQLLGGGSSSGSYGSGGASSFQSYGQASGQSAGQASGNRSSYDRAGSSQDYQPKNDAPYDGGYDNSDFPEDIPF
ncbi:single-stranded DNA-binding protein [Treponema sp. HNW]|uniref:single-stranded DNA-binding protein n=1 Tax=Treponema sp. HNW TaxID=3116654 RepID=UPI003D11AA54